MKFRARKEGKRLEYNRDLISKYLERWKEGDIFICEIRRPQKTESDPLRKYYFGGVLTTFMNHLGYDKDEKLFFHHQLKEMYFDPQPDKYGFKHTPSVFSKNSELPITGEATDDESKRNFIEFVKRLAAREGCYIEDPE